MGKILTGALLATTFVASVAAAAPGAGKPAELALRGPVRALAADGTRVAVVVSGRNGCASVVVWAPSSRRVARLQSAARCESSGASLREGTDSVALAGTRAAWLRTAGGNSLEMWLQSATLARTSPVDIAMTATTGDAGHGEFIRRPIGDGSLIAFTVEHRCDAFNPDEDECSGRKHGSVLGAAVYAVGGPGMCPTRARRDPPGCSRIASEDGELTVLAVDTGRTVVRADTGIRLLTRTGSVLRRFDVAARAASLSGKRLALRTAEAAEVYDVASGDLVRKVPAPSGVRLEDLEGDVLVTASAGTVTLRRVSSGRTAIVRVAGVARAQLEPAGLFVSGARRVTFTPMRDVLRRLGG